MKHIRVYFLIVLNFPCAWTLGEDVQALLRREWAEQAIANLTNPAKLATLKGELEANPRLQKCVYWLAYAEGQGEKPEAVLDESAKLNKTAATPYAGFLSWGLLENLKIAKEPAICVSGPRVIH